MVKGGKDLDRSAMHLLHRAGQCAAEIFPSEARTSGLTPRQFAVLMVVADEEGLTQTELVERTGIDRSTLADIVARLLAPGADPAPPHQGRCQSLCHQAQSAGRKALREAQPGAAAADQRLLGQPPGRQAAGVPRHARSDRRPRPTSRAASPQACSFGFASSGRILSLTTSPR